MGSGGSKAASASFGKRRLALETLLLLTNLLLLGGVLLASGTLVEVAGASTILANTLSLAIAASGGVKARHAAANVVAKA